MVVTTKLVAVIFEPLVIRDIQINIEEPETGRQVCDPIHLRSNAYFPGYAWSTTGECFVEQLHRSDSNQKLSQLPSNFYPLRERQK